MLKYVQQIGLFFNQFVMQNDELPVGSLDLPDERDFWAEHLLGVDKSKELPSKVKLMTEANNQGNSVKCTCYSTYSVGTILNEIEHKHKIDDLPDIGWELQKKFGTYGKKGDYVQTALSSVKKNGIRTAEGIYDIEGYARVKHEDVKYWLAEGHPLVTSGPVTKTNFKKAKYEGEWTGNDGDTVAGHAFALIGYEPGFYWALNSYGPTWGFFSDGTFKIPEELLKDLGGTYILYDKKDVKRVFKDVSEDSWFVEACKWGKKNEIVKGYEDGSFRPESPITRAEMLQVLYDYHNKFNS